jgi:hypothetical protein
MSIISPRYRDRSGPAAIASALTCASTRPSTANCSDLIVPEIRTVLGPGSGAGLSTAAVRDLPAHPAMHAKQTHVTIMNRILGSGITFTSSQHPPEFSCKKRWTPVAS